MSETTTHQFPDLAKPDFRQPSTIQDSIDALRSAVVAQTALLRSLSEQVRLNQEAIVNWFSLNRDQQAKVNNQLVGLAERLEKLEAQIVTYDTNQTERAVTFSGRLAAIEAKLTPDPFPKEWLKAFSAAQSKPNQSLTSKKSKPAAARRKAKR